MVVEQREIIPDHQFVAPRLEAGVVSLDQPPVDNVIDIQEARAARTSVFARPPELLYPNNSDPAAFNTSSILHPITRQPIDIGRVRERPVGPDGKVLDDGMPDVTNLYILQAGREPRKLEVPIPDGYTNVEDPRLTIEDGQLTVLLTVPRADGTWYPFETKINFTEDSIEDHADEGTVFPGVKAKNYTPAFDGYRFIRNDSQIDPQDEHRLYLVEPDGDNLTVKGVLDIPVVPWNEYRAGSVGEPLPQTDGTYIQFIHGIKETSTPEQEQKEYSIGAMRYRFDSGKFEVLEITQEPLIKPSDVDEVVGPEAQAIPGKVVAYGTDNGIDYRDLDEPEVFVNEDAKEIRIMRISIGDNVTTKVYMDMDKVRERLAEGKTEKPQQPLVSGVAFTSERSSMSNSAQ